MFDTYAQELIRQLPELPGLDQKECRRYLSKAYFFILRQKIELDGDITKQDSSSFSEVVSYLRNLANTLETIAIFDPLNGIDIPVNVQRSCAFVAAEALSLLKSLIGTKAVEESDLFRLETNYVAFESALLYMFGGYDVNARSVIEDVKNTTISEASLVQTSAYRLVTNLLRLCKGDVRPSPISQMNEIQLFTALESATYGQLIKELRVRFYTELARGISLFLDWLAGIEGAVYDNAISILDKVHRAAGLGGNRGITEFADIYHFSSILIATLQQLKERSVVHVVPEPETDDKTFLEDFRAYLRSRARGSEERNGRPYLWPTALEYIEKCLPGPNRDCVISMPTGSGKSFVAELAISHALSEGWVLYLAPTNALVHQIRRDLKEAFNSMKMVQVRAFVGGEEYSQLQDTAESIMSTDVVVMTPEKCALAIRLHPELFANCALCVFDECHLLNDEGRGLTADIVMAELMNIAPNIKFLLMSAMISNPDELAEWLRSVHDPNAVTALIKWRPSRTLRGLVIVDSGQLDDLFNRAKQQAEQLTGHRKNVNFEVPLALLVGLSGPWTTDGPADYTLCRLPVTFPFKATKGESTPNNDSWKNTASRLVAERFAQAGIPVINFILTSRHHAFSGATRSSAHMEKIFEPEQFEPLVKAWLSIADTELGVPTVLWDLFQRGIAVHSSAMLQVEQAASEWMFVNQKAKLMFATGTLAQGLNLPAVAVIISGTSLGDSRGEIDNVYGVSKVNSLILNGFGRAGRPGFSNQGVGILVSDRPIQVQLEQRVVPLGVLREYPVLSESDASVEIHSPVERFISAVASDTFVPETALPSELVLTSMLVENNDIETDRILVKTFGAFHARRNRQDNWLESAALRVKEIRDNFIMKPDVPEWLNAVSTLSGVDFFRASRMLDAYKRRGIPNSTEAENYSVLDWLDVFIEVLSYMPPKRFSHLLPDDTYKGNTILRKMRDAIGRAREVDDPEWTLPENWRSLWFDLRDLLLLYMNGASYKKLASKYLSIDAERISNGRSSGGNPIPSVFKLIRTVFEPLAVDAGCFVALNEHLVFSNEESVKMTDQLQALPLCIRYGCDSLGTLSWFRYGIRQRVCAHALQEKYPVPITLESEGSRAKWVRRRRQEWLDTEWDDDDKLLHYARIVILNGDE
jgi:hypothetical protein